jgi:hypothetical protein
MLAVDVLVRAGAAALLLAEAQPQAAHDTVGAK